MAWRILTKSNFGLKRHYNDDPIPCYIVEGLASSFGDMALDILQVMLMLLILRQLVPEKRPCLRSKYGQRSRATTRHDPKTRPHHNLK
jgi:hypothetical protein